MVPAGHITMRNFILLLALICRGSQSSALLLAMWESSQRTPFSNGLCLGPVWPVTKWVLLFSCTLAMVPRRPHRVRHLVLDCTERANHRKSDAGKTVSGEVSPNHYLLFCFSFQKHLSSSQLQGKKFNNQNWYGKSRGLNPNRCCSIRRKTINHPPHKPLSILWNPFHESNTEADQCLTSPVWSIVKRKFLARI